MNKRMLQFLFIVTLQLALLAPISSHAITAEFLNATNITTSSATLNFRNHFNMVYSALYTLNISSIDYVTDGIWFKGGDEVLHVDVNSPLLLCGRSYSFTLHLEEPFSGPTTTYGDFSTAACPTIPGAPTTTALVSWGTNDSYSYTVKRKIKGTTAEPVNSVVQPGANDTSITDTGLLHNTIYEYTITDDTQSGLSSLVTVHTPLYTGWNQVGVPHTDFTLDGTISTYYEWKPSGEHYDNAEEYDTKGIYERVTTPVVGHGYFARPGNATTKLDYADLVGATGTTLVAEIILQPGYTLVSPPKTGLAEEWMIRDELGTVHNMASATQINQTIYYWDGIDHEDVSITGGTVEQFKAYWILNLGTAPVTLIMH